MQGFQGKTILIPNAQKKYYLKTEAFSQPPFDNNKEMIFTDKANPRKGLKPNKLENPVVRRTIYMNKLILGLEERLEKNFTKYGLQKEEAEAEGKKKGLTRFR